MTEGMSLRLEPLVAKESALEGMLTAKDQMVGDYRIADADRERLARQFDEQQLLEVLFVMLSYSCLALILHVVGLKPDRDVSGGWDAFQGLEN